MRLFAKNLRTFLLALALGVSVWVSGKTTSVNGAAEARLVVNQAAAATIMGPPIRKNVLGRVIESSLRADTAPPASGCPHPGRRGSGFFKEASRPLRARRRRQPHT